MILLLFLIEVWLPGMWLSASVTLGVLGIQSRNRWLIALAIIMFGKSIISALQHIETNAAEGDDT